VGGSQTHCPLACLALPSPVPTLLGEGSREPESRRGVGEQDEKRELCPPLSSVVGFQPQWPAKQAEERLTKLNAGVLTVTGTVS
jgi:hypothetical protein